MEEKLNLLKQQQAQLMSDLNATGGAIQICEQLLAQLEKVDIPEIKVEKLVKDVKSVISNISQET